MKPKSAKPPQIALALAGDGLRGAIYEIGALCTLDESLIDLDFTELDHYAGVCAGGFIAASLQEVMDDVGDVVGRSLNPISGRNAARLA